MIWIDERLRAAGWRVQDEDEFDFNAGPGIALREYQTDIVPADYVLFADWRAVDIVVDTRNLGEQAERKFMAFVSNDDIKIPIIGAIQLTASRSGFELGQGVHHVVCRDLMASIFGTLVTASSPSFTTCGV